MFLMQHPSPSETAVKGKDASEKEEGKFFKVTVFSGQLCGMDADMAPSLILSTLSTRLRETHCESTYSILKGQVPEKIINFYNLIPS